MINKHQKNSSLNTDMESQALSLSFLESHRKHFKDFRKKIIERPLLPYAFLEIYPKPSAKKAISYGNDILVNGWTVDGQYVTSLTPPLSWSFKVRSLEVKLHSWQHVHHLLLAYDYDKNWKYFQSALNIIEDWISACPIQLTEISLVDASEYIKADYQKGSWWYDMAIAQRLSQLAYIVDICCRHPEINDVRVFSLMDHILLHHIILTSNLFYKKHTNHGFFQALNQFAAIKRLPEFDHEGFFLKMVQERLGQMIEQQYTGEMFHREHSPGYHYMITAALVNAYRSQLLDEEESAELRQAEINLGWMVSPSGNIVTFGDTDPRNLFNKANIEFFKEPSFVEMLSGGKQVTGVKPFYESGYAFARLFGEDSDKNNPLEASYLAQISGFHSRVHKHADHLSFVWFDKKRDILIDPGRYGYIGRTEKGSDLWNQGFWYSDPKRIYCETTRAHNTIEIDGQSFPRKGVTPFGSALLYAGEVDGRAITYSKAVHFKSISHHRQLIMSPGHFLIVLDWLKDFKGAERDYRQYFHFASEWDIYEDKGQIVGHHPGMGEELPADIRVANLIPEGSLEKVVRGQENPELLGWLSDKSYSFIPTSCTHVHQRTSDPVSFATLFVFGKTLDVNWEKTRFNKSLSAGRVEWNDDKGKQVLYVERPKV